MNAPQEDTPLLPPELAPDETTGAHIGFLMEHFGLPLEAFHAIRVERANKKLLVAIAVDHQTPTRPTPLSTGLPFLHTNMRIPKLTTWASMWLGPHMTRSYMELDRAQTDAYLRRDPFSVPVTQAPACFRGGYALMRHEGVALGLSMIWLDEDAGVWTVESLYPGAQKLASGRSAFGAGTADDARGS